MTAVLSARTIAAALGQFPPTDEQVAVIEAPLTPALVVAGAGSGKTETMASRVVWLVANALVRRDEVLGLTFTRKAAGELAERIQRRLQRLAEFERRGLLPFLPDLHADGRLDAFGELERGSVLEHADGGSARGALMNALAVSVGAVAAGADEDALLHRPTVSTYNSFADQIVREHAVRIGRDAEAAILSESAAWLLMRRVVFASDDPRLEERGEAIRSIIDASLRIARDGVDNLISFDELAGFPQRFRDVLDRPSTRKATVVYKDVEDAEANVAALALLADLAREYSAQKRRIGVLDFSDQVAGALEAVRAHAAIAGEMRERFRVVLLDEYQDTSVAQTDLLAALFAGTAVMAVGDPHQAIYGWRGASAGNLGGFATAFGTDVGGGIACLDFSLLTSWRNSADVLTAANAVLEPLAATAAVSVSELRARPGAPRGAVELAFHADLDAEADRVAGWFEDVRAARAEAGRATTGAVLFRSKKHMVRFGDALGRRGIPHRILGLGGLLSTPEVVDVVSVLRVLSDPGAGSALIRLLVGPRWAIGLPDLRELAALARRITRHDAALQPLPPEMVAVIRGGAGDDEGSLIDALDFVLRHKSDHGWLAAFSPHAQERLRDAAAVFGGLRRAVGMPVPDLVRLVELELRLDIELAANEARGPARIASAQLRAFVDELQGFLAADESGSLTNLLAWLDHAEQRDEFAPRTEPPEDDVVQLLTIHGSKGLEWDAVAVVRLVKDELPSAPRDTKAWLGFGVLPYSFRGDANWLPALQWERHVAPTQQDLKVALDDFVAANRSRQLDEDRRLAYVAVTRARDHLLLTGASWSGTKRPRQRSVFFDEVANALGHDLVQDDPGEDPYLGERRVLEWPIDPLGSRRERVHRAAEIARTAGESPRVAADDDLALLLAEREQRQSPRAAPAPTRIAASRYKEFVADYAGTVARLSRPLPERPFAQTRRGTLFHAWVEHRSGVTGLGRSIDDGLWALEDDVTSASSEDAVILERLKATFAASEWGSLSPIEVETEIDFTLTGLDDRPHIVICKLDAVYRRADRGDRIEIVDWKTGAPPRGESEREERMLQLELYRRAYHHKHGVPLEEIDVALYYVAHDLVLRG